MKTIDNNKEKEFNDIELNILIHDISEGNFPRCNTKETFFSNSEKE